MSASSVRVATVLAVKLWTGGEVLVVRRSFRFVLRPTARQAHLLTEMLADHCSLYNGALEERRTAYRQCGVTVTYGMQSGQLKDIRRFDRSDTAGGRFPRSRPRCAASTRRCRCSSAASKPGRHRDIPGSGVSAGSTRGPLELHPTRPGHPCPLPGCGARPGPPAPPGRRHSEDRVGETGGRPLVRSPVLR